MVVEDVCVRVLQIAAHLETKGIRALGAGWEREGTMKVACLKSVSDGWGGLPVMDVHVRVLQNAPHLETGGIVSRGVGGLKWEGAKRTRAARCISVPDGCWGCTRSSK
jgi:hypothetical protein